MRCSAKIESACYYCQGGPNPSQPTSSSSSAAGSVIYCSGELAPLQCLMFSLLYHHYCFAIFNLIFPPPYIFAQRKRVNCPAHLWSPKNAQTTPTPVPKTGDDQGTASKVPEKAEDKPTKMPNSPLKPVEPIQIPKPNEDERLKQLESPETVELIKSFEIPDPVTDKPSEPEPVATPEPPVKPPVVAVKPQPIVVPEPPKKSTDPTDSLFSPPTTQDQGNKQPAKDIKEATSDFLSQEFNQPKKSSKRYTKSRQKNNHS